MFSFSSIKEYHSFLANTPNGCVLAVQHYLQKIKDTAHLNAYLEVFEEEALQRAVALDEERNLNKPIGKLHGVVVSLKDVICFKGHKVSAASKILEPYVSIYNATAVEKLLNAGAIVIGRNNCDEFAMGSANEHSAFGVVKNALNEKLVPGGSSGGSAVAVQANTCMISLGSDTGGSVRQPADFCGVVGVKPSYGRISRYGLIAYASSFDQIGIFGNSVEDVTLVLETIAGADDFDSTVSDKPVPDYLNEIGELSVNKKFRIAYFKEMLEHDALDKEIKLNILRQIDQLKAEGHIVTPLTFNLLKYIVPAYYVLTTAEASSNLSRFDGVRYGYRSKKNFTDLTEMYKATRSEGFGKEVKRRIMLGTFVLSAGYYDAYFTKAQQVRKILHTQTTEIFKDFDVLIGPTVPSTAFEIGNHSTDPVEIFLADIYTVFANLVGIPGISIPLYKHSNGMPFGLQVMSSHFDEVNLLAFSRKLLGR
ncbi:MAG: Asp-tRNA(Asn)/Glu-tRNA(Gln) amidotransferase subunit GatA [Sphingobacteriia bacterium]|nr:Asp-tRNA(Asn)/Glu-tRNA(Gln) amidotransferase subunit GatA [Sphingobacteriia bacterium]